MSVLKVWLTFPDGSQVIAGEIAVNERKSRNDPGSVFRYTQEYLDHAKQFPLDPCHLPLSDEEFLCDRVPEDIHSVFEDSLPDAWGRRLIAKKYGIAIRTSELIKVLPFVSDHGIGALSYGNNFFNHDTAQLHDLSQLLKAAEMFERGEDIEADYQLLLNVGSSVGGARPKALLVSDQGFWLAKFPSVNDSAGIVPLESACLTLASQAGLVVPEHNVVNVGGKAVLLVKRFDIAQSGGRNHVISMRSLIGDRFHVRYQDLAQMIRLYSDQPEKDLPLLFRQMVFNVFIGNTDDHDKNFSMLHSVDGWSLTPCYDLLPNINRSPEHALQFLSSSYPPDMAEMNNIGVGLFSLTRQKAVSIIDEVRVAVQNWRQVFEQSQVPDRDIKLVSADIEKRLK